MPAIKRSVSIVESTDLIDENLSNAPKNIKKRLNNNIDVTYDQAIINYARSLGAIRNIIKDDDEDCSHILRMIQKGNICADDKITNIKKKGKCNFSLECSNYEEFSKVDIKFSKYVNFLLTSVMCKNFYCNNCINKRLIYRAIKGGYTHIALGLKKPGHARMMISKIK